MSTSDDKSLALCHALEARFEAAIAETPGDGLATMAVRAAQMSSLVRIAFGIARLSDISVDSFVASVGRQVRGPEAQDSTDVPDCGDGACLDCRIRRACGFTGNVPTDIQPPIYALGNVLAELLAFLPTRTAEALVAALLVAREKWQREPRVAAQMPPAGSA